MLLYYWYKKEVNLTMFNILTLSCTNKYYIVIENIFFVIVCNVLVLYKYLKNMLMVVLKLMTNRWLKWPKMVKLLSLNYVRKINLLFKIYADFETILLPENNWKQNPDETFTNKC